MVIKKLPPFLASIAKKKHCGGAATLLLTASSSLSSLSSQEVHTEESSVSADNVSMKKNDAVIVTTTATDISRSVTSIGSTTSVSSNRKRKKELESSPSSSLLLQTSKRNICGVRKTGAKSEAPVLRRKMYSPFSPVALSSANLNRKENVPPPGATAFEYSLRQKRTGVTKCVSSISLCVDATAYTCRTSRRKTTNAYASKDAVEIGSYAEKIRPRRSDDDGIRRLRQSSSSSRTLAYDNVQIRGLKKKMRDVINRPERNVFMGLL